MRRAPTTLAMAEETSTTSLGSGCRAAGTWGPEHAAVHFVMNHVMHYVMHDGMHDVRSCTM